MPNLLKSDANVVRFMPGRRSDDGKMLFEGARYVRGTVEAASAPKLGVAIGPTDGMQNDVVKMSAGGIILPVQPSDDFKTVDVKTFSVKDRNDPKKKVQKSIVKLATFADLGNHVVVRPYNGEDVVYFEIWTGDFARKTAEATFQLIQANMFSCGSVAYVGNAQQMVVVDAKSKKRAKTSETDTVEDEMVGDMKLSGGTGAKLVSERQGDIVGGVPLWVARKFAVHFSAQDSEAVLVRQLNDFWLCSVQNGLPTIEPVPAEKYVKRFERLFIDQPIKAVSEKTAAPAAAA